MTFKQSNGDVITSPNQSDCKTSKTTENCAVCGDLATGFHYEVASCNGCKTFFRRTLVSNRTYKCHKNGNCTFNKDMRCACRACRFNKCVAVGMNPKAIQCNRTGRIASPQEAPTSTTSPHSSSESELLPQQPQVSTSTGDGTMEGNKLQRLFSQGTGSGRKRSSASPDSESASKRSYTISAILDFKDSGRVPNEDENSSHTRSQPEVSSSSSLSVVDVAYVHHAIRMHCAISEKHENLISHLIRTEERISELLALKDCYTSVTFLDMLSRPPITVALPSSCNDNLENEPQNYCNDGPTAVLNQKLAVIVEYAKTFEFFQWMPVRDKIILLRDIVFALISLETAYERLCSKNASILNHQNRIEASSQLNERNSGMLVTIESLNRAKLDRKEYLLLKAITFVHSECFGLTANSYTRLNAHRQLTLDTLFKYMTSKHEREAPVRFGHALSVLWSLYKTSSNYTESLAGMELAPLTRELLGNKLPEFLAQK